MIKRMGAEIDIVGGDTEQGIALYQYPNGDGKTKECPIAELTATNGIAEITRAINGANAQTQLPFEIAEEHLPF